MAYSKEQIDEMFERIVKGIAEDGESLRSVLNRHSMPSRKTFFQWLDGDEEKINQYARACEARAENIFEEILEIADESNADYGISDDGKLIINGEMVQRSRLKVDARKWVLSKMNPKKYGDKTDITTNGKDINISPIEWVE